MKKNHSLQGTVVIVLLALACPWQTTAASEEQEKKFLLPMQAVDTGCEAFIKRNKIKEVHECAVSETGAFGSVDGQAYDYALYTLNKDEDKGLSIFTHEAAGKQGKLLLDRFDEEGAVLYYRKPEMANHSFGTLLHVPIGVYGTGNFNESECYLWSEKQKGWKLLDSTSWVDDLGKRLPAGLEIWKGVWPDIKTMTAKTALWRENDANCCPSGGTAAVALAVKDGRFVIKSLEIREDEVN